MFWGAQGAAGVDIQGIIYAGAGTNWSPSPVITFASGLPANVAFQAASTGVTPGGLEDGFFVSWESGGGILGQRFDLTGAAVGQQIVVGDPTSGTPGLHSTVGIDDGRMLVGYEDGGDVSAQFLDNREPGVAIIGPRTGAPRDVLVGTVGDDAIDGRALDDQLYGGLGNDLITLGSGNDMGFGGLGNDTLIGGSGQDQLFGEAGDDLLWGGTDGTPDPQIERDLPANLQGPGIDLISGGDGIDTISYRGEFGRFDVDLDRGSTLSDRTGSGTFTAEDAIGQMVTDAAGVTTLVFTHDVENVEGGIGNDVIKGDAGANVLTGFGGNDLIDGRGGIDSVVFSGNRVDYQITLNADGSLTVADTRAGSPDGTDIVRNVELLVFADTTIPLPSNTPPTITSNGGGDTAAISIAENTTAVTDVDATDPDAGQVLTYSIAGGADAAKFAINPNTGVLAFVTAPDFETPTDVGLNNVYDVVVQVSDANGGIDSQAIAVTVTDVAGITVTSNAAITAGTGENDTLTGGAGANTLNGLGGNDVLVGAAGADTLNGGAGNDTLTGGAGNDVVNGDAGNDTINYTFGDGADTVNGGAGTDSLHITGTGGADTLDVVFNGATLTNFEGGTVTGVESVFADLLGGVDTLTFAGTTADIAVNLTAGTASGFASIANIENVVGGSGNDALVGTIGANNLQGGAGNDTLDGAGGNDTMVGGAGDDTYITDGGDTLTEGTNAGTDTVVCSVNFTLANNFENLTLSGSADTTGTGNAADNGITGNDGNNTLNGAAGNDTLIGGGGNDTLIGGTGLDTLFGGLGNDTFVFNALNESGVGAGNNDVIADFEGDGAAVGDLIDLSAIDANANVGGNNAFTFIGTAAFTAAGQLRYTQVGGDTIVQANTNANTGNVEFEVRLAGLHTLTGSDFLL